MSSFEERLRKESTGWVEEGLLSAEQRAALLSRHPIPETAGGRFLAILALIGGTLTLAGVCLLIGANWQEIGDWTKIGGLVVLLIAAYVAGWKLKIAPGHFPRLGEALFMIGAGLLIAGIALVSQIYHLNDRPASAVGAWWLGIVAVPWLVRSRGAQAVSLTAALTWFGMELSADDSWLRLLPENARGEPWVLVAAFTVAGMIVWFAGLGLRRSRYADFAGLHEIVGLVLVCGGLYVLGFLRHGLRWDDSLSPAAWPPLAFLAVLMVASVVGAWRSCPRETSQLLPWMLVASIPLLAVFMAWRLDDGGWLWSALAWSSLFVLNVFTVRVGLATGRESWVNLALLCIAVNIVTRYFDLFGTMLEGGVFFVVTGVVVLTLGIFLERRRRVWLASMRRAGREGSP